jgi:hypothetical protein
MSLKLILEASCLCVLLYCEGDFMFLVITPCCTLGVTGTVLNLLPASSEFKCEYEGNRFLQNSSYCLPDCVMACSRGL